MVKNNQMLPQKTLRKEGRWTWHVKTWFDQPAKKKARRVARAAKAAGVFPKPVEGLLRPVVHPPTQKYNMKTRYGRGFTIEELKGAGINPLKALSIGIAVDHRRSNKSEESFKANVQRLKTYNSKLVLFPRNPNKPKKGEATAADMKNATQLEGKVLPLGASSRVEKARKVTAADTKGSVVATLRKVRADARLVGVRAARKLQKEREAKEKELGGGGKEKKEKKGAADEE